MQRFFAPGRTELAGNHTDHQLGRVLAASVDVGITARAARRRDRRVCIHSKGSTARSSSATVNGRNPFEWIHTRRSRRRAARAVMPTSTDAASTRPS